MFEAHKPILMFNLFFKNINLWLQAVSRIRNHLKRVRIWIQHLKKEDSEAKLEILESLKVLFCFCCLYHF